MPRKRKQPVTILCYSCEEEKPDKEVFAVKFDSHFRKVYSERKEKEGMHIDFLYPFPENVNICVSCAEEYI